MLTFLRTLKFFKVLLTKSKQTTTIENKCFAITTHLSLDTDIYHAKGKYQGTILFVHGMNKHGKNDERLKHFCLCLAAIGYRVIVPSYPIICQHTFSLQSIDEIEATIKFLTENNTLCPSGKIAIFTVSLSGTLTMRAAGRESVKNRVSIFFTIGSGFYVERVFQLAFERPEQDSYMKMICIKNVLASNLDTPKEILQAMDVAIADAFVNDTPNNLPALLSQMTVENQQFMQRIIGPEANASFLYPIYKDYLATFEKQLFSSCPNENLNFPMILIHSAIDHVFPPNETIDFCQYLTDHNIPHDICITTLMEHVDHNLSLKKLPEIWQLIRLFYKFFKHI